MVIIAFAHGVFFFSAHRHATKVRGLEAYGIDPAVFGRQVQKRFACSTAAQPAPVKMKRTLLAYFLTYFTVVVAYLEVCMP